MIIYIFHQLVFNFGVADILTSSLIKTIQPTVPYFTNLIKDMISKKFDKTLHNIFILYNDLLKEIRENEV